MSLLIRDPDLAIAAHLRHRTSLSIDHDAIAALAGVSFGDAVDAVVGETVTTTDVPDTVGLGDVPTWWVEQMVAPGAGLHERMTWFWHSLIPTHVAKITHGPLIPQQLQMIRRNALGSYRDLLQGFVHDGAMMQYLDLSNSQPPIPNENLARELMELFSLGEGHYSETDVKHAALALTGWRVTLVGGAISFHPEQHHSGPVEILGVRKSWSSEELVDHLLSFEQSAIYIAGKVHEHLVGSLPDQAAGHELGRWWHQNGYAITPLVARILRSEAFRASRGARVRSGLEFYTAARSVLGRGGSELHQLLELDQAPYRPPNVGGWPIGEVWLTPGPMLPRLRFAAAADFVDPVDATTGSLDALLDRCGIHELSQTTFDTLLAIEDDARVNDDRELRAARIRLLLASPEFQLS